MRIGVDLGGTKTEAAALDSDGRVAWRRRVPTPAEDYDAIVGAVAGLIAQADAELSGQPTIGIGTPGAISPATGRLKNANTVVLNGKPLHADLEAAIGRPVRLANDANCFALSEAIDGAAKGLAVVFGVIIGTGTGGGIVVDGHPLRGPNAIAGEWGHNPLPWPTDAERPGPRCYCGQSGCIESFVSGPGLARDHGQALAAAEIAKLAEQGDAQAVASLTRYEDRLARALAGVINILDPDMVVLGGGLSNIDRLYTNVPQLLPKYVFSDRVDTPLCQAMHGDSSGVRGAAWLWR